MNKLTVGVVQATPVFFNLNTTLERVDYWLQQASEQNSDLVLFPESFIPGYPRGFTFDASIGHRSDQSRDLYQKYWENSVAVPSREVELLADLAKKYRTYLGIGVTERDQVNGTLYCTLLYFSPEYGYLGKHRKLKPTGVERLVWGEGQADTLIAVNTKVGRLGGLICWENYMPLARMAMYKMGVQIYLAPTADARANWTATLQHIALEGRCFVLGCNQFFRREDYPAEYQLFVKDYQEDFCRGGSIIVGPDGEVLSGPLYNKEGILTATINLTNSVRHKLDFDVVGHYSRDDVFDLTISGQPSIIQEDKNKIK
ncbi:MAG: carbon-nitrogen hydrolase family protein [Tunicatimonas sp.]|uniref:carbon-nitrogen hydrolase family protein n=1 Tax=Tunicatimonas sp. TaxID=1940096 RepID=UPI003C74BECF